ncbi:MaoC/PaaZ C-terminal domain-containing protein [Castellaniella sp.]|uniref:MaoC/PaaZ C-terminal domain-containing protein n=1 Tax=Castellaniella sp. TaxID=1955812 RepID=UPI003C7679E0
MTNTLPFSAGALGAELAPLPMRVTARNLMSYAAVMGAHDACYLDDSRSEGIVGLPTFTVVPEWRVMNGAAYRAVLAADDERMWRCIHVQQDSRFLRPIRPGQTVVVRGKICALRQTRIGVYVAVRLDTVLEDTGDLATQSWFCGIFLGDRLQGDGGAIAEPPALPAARDIAAWESAPEPVLVVSRALPHLYTEAAAIWNPIHTERVAARAAGLKDTLLHGTCTWGSAGLALIRRLAQGDPGRLARLGARMVGKACVGETLFLRYCVRDEPPDTPVRSVAFQVLDSAGGLILDDGIAEVLHA